MLLECILVLSKYTGDGYYSFTKIATADDTGEYGCFVDTVLNDEVSYKYVNLTVAEIDEVTTESTEENVMFSAVDTKEANRKMKINAIRKKAGNKLKN